MESKKNVMDALESLPPEEQGALLDGMSTEPPAFFENNKFLHHIMGDYLTQKYGVCKINNVLHIYEGGIYRPGEDIMHGLMIDLAPALKHNNRTEVYKYMRASRKTAIKELSPPNLIPFKNRIYDISNDTFIDYSKDYVFLNRFPYDYDPHAPECPIVTDTIAQIADNDEDIINLLYEAMGNCFYLINSFRGAVMLYGANGSNGKSTLLNMTTQLLGKENCSFLSLQDTAERFKLAEIYGKAGNIGDDIPDKYLEDSSLFKKLVTGEEVMGERKGQDPFNFKPYAKMFFAMNALSRIHDKTKAFFSRLLLIPLNADFSQVGKKDVSLKDRRWTDGEMQYLTRLAVDGLKRLINQGDFTRPQAVKDALHEYELENNPVMAYLEECGDVEGMNTDHAYNQYKNFCIGGNYKPLTKTKFSQEIKSLTGLATKPTRIDGEGCRIYRKP